MDPREEGTAPLCTASLFLGKLPKKRDAVHGDAAKQNAVSLEFNKEFKFS